MRDRTEGIPDHGVERLYARHPMVNKVASREQEKGKRFNSQAKGKGLRDAGIQKILAV